MLKQAKKLKKELVDWRRKLHQIPETGFGLKQTTALVRRTLVSQGYTVRSCGNSGLVATIGKGEPRLLLRADMDGLPIQEQTGLGYASKNGNMHACGHDFHTAMLLGAAKLLKERESELTSQVTLAFQPAEELLEGAKSMLSAGLLRERHEAALMLHITTGVDLPTGSVVISNAKQLAPSADYFEIRVQGKGCHGAMPSEGIDALTAAARIVLGLQEIPSRETGLSERALITVGKLSAGNAPNALADSAVIFGTMRCYGEPLRQRIQARMREIAEGIAKSFRATAQVEFTHGCPAFENDTNLAESIYNRAVTLFGKEKVILTGEGGGGSEDFAYISRLLPTTMAVVCAGEKKKGYEYPLHHPKARFDEGALCVGAALFADAALNSLAFFREK